MNGRFSFVYMILVSCIGCTSYEKQDILTQPPFASLTDSLKQSPSNPDLLLQRGELLAQHDQHELAYLDFKEAWDKRQSEEIAMAYVSNLFLVNRPSQAVTLLEVAVKKFPDNPEFRRRLSEAYVQTGYSKKAMEQYDSILRVDSNNFEAWYEKGLLCAQLKDTSRAIAALQRSWELQPLSLNGISLAYLYALTKNPDAVAICDHLIRKDSANESLDPIYIKGIFYSNTKHHKLAIEQFEECIRKDWKFTDAYIEKGIVLFEIKNIDEALQTFKLASTISPRNADSYYWQGKCFEAIGKKEDAMDSYIRAYSIDRSNKEARERIESLRKNP